MHRLVRSGVVKELFKLASMLPETFDHEGVCDESAVHWLCMYFASWPS